MFDLLILDTFHFLRPYWLLSIFPILMIIKSFYRRDNNLTLWRQVMSAEILQHLTVTSSNPSRFTPKSVMVIFALLSCMVAAGPSWKQQASPFSEDKSALVIALDVSQSMNQGDIQPSRLLRAKQKILELLAVRGDAKTALIAFSGSAHTIMPITNDSDMIRHFLDSLNNSLMPKPGKLPETVLPITKQLFQATQVPGTLLVLGDGATSETVVQFTSFFKSSSHQLIYWAFGNANSAKNEGDILSSIIPLQLSQLTALTDNSNGQLVLMTHDKQDVLKVNQYIENNLTLVNDSAQPWHDEGYPLVFIMAACFLLWFRRGWTLQW